MQENSLIKQNILKYLDLKGITPYRFYKENNVTRGILTQNNGITEENLLKFVRFAQDISLEWLLTGEGSMLRSEDNNFTIVSETRADEAQSAVVDTLKAMIKEQAKEIARLELLNDHLKEEISVLNASLGGNDHVG